MSDAAPPRAVTPPPGEVDPPPGEVAVPPGERAGRSVVHSFVRFINRTARRANIIWVDYNGQAVHMNTLEPAASVNVNTFVGHPWLFRDSSSGDKLAVQCHEVYRPPAWYSQRAADRRPARRTVYITLPGEAVTTDHTQASQTPSASY